MTESFDLNWPYRFGEPEFSALLKASAEDFQVVENLGFEPSGEGEHVFVYLRKTGENTAWIAKKLAEYCNIPVSSVSWAGLKDRHAVTEQWFGLHIPGKITPDLSGFNSDTVSILRVTRHHKKLRPGVLVGNHFCIRLREIERNYALDYRLQMISESGVPNYFGPQRFGREGNNLIAAADMFSGRRVNERHKRVIYLSAARSYLCNQLIAARVKEDKLNTPLLGDYLLGSNGQDFSYLAKKDLDSVLLRLKYGELTTSVPLWGRGENQSQSLALEWEMSQLQPFQDWMVALEKAGMQQERRSAILKAQNLRWRWLDDGLEIRLSLPAGSYATSLLRELVIIRENNHDEDPSQ